MHLRIRDLSKPLRKYDNGTTNLQNFSRIQIFKSAIQIHTLRYLVLRVLFCVISVNCPSRSLLGRIAHWNPSSLPIILMLEVEDMLITWCGSLAVLLNKLWRTLFKVEKIEDNFEETIKRYGVYLFCIDDLPL